MDQNQVAQAFDILLEEIENSIDGLNQEGAEAFQKGNYDSARDLMEKGSHMTAFREKVRDLQREWRNLFSIAHFQVTEPTIRRPRIRKVRQRLKHGLRTPEDTFYVPILQALVEKGGVGQAREILDSVGKMMESIFNKYDLSFLSSNPKETRWRKTANWARRSMIKEGLLSSNSPRGVWEITETGRQWLANTAKQSP